jgi:multicomponent Na+:H+ antiporter subunit F
MIVALPTIAAAWSGMLVEWVTSLSMIVLALCMLVCMYRVVRGPHLADRALGADTLGIMLIGLVVLLCMMLKTLMFFDGILVLSLLGFAGTVAMAQYIGRPHMKKRSESKAD